MLAWLRALFAESPLQLYRGYEPADIDLVRRYTTARAALHDDHYVDGFGVKTSYACVPFQDPGALSTRRLQSPFPDDGFHAEGIEYVALVDAIDRFSSDGTFCAIEAGAGWGPWLAMAGVVCKAKKVEHIRLIGLEASAERFALMTQHHQKNHLKE